MKQIRLLVVAEDPLARAGLAVLLADFSDCLVVGQLSSGDATAVSLPDDFDVLPDVIIWDVGWEPSEYLPDWEEVAMPVLALLPDADEATTVLASGVQGLLARSVGGRRLLAAARAVALGLVVLDPDFTTAMLDVSQPGETAVLSDPLTAREAEVLQLLAEGLTNKAIANRLEISDHTVKFHVNAIMSKLHAQSRTEAVVRATRQGLILL